MPILISIRTIHVQNIFNGFKRVEFRKFFPKDYRGTMIIYECGPNSEHKVVGKFHTRNVQLYDPKVGVTPELIEGLRETDYTDFDLDCMRRITEPTFCIPIISPMRITLMDLGEFSALYKTNPVLTPPRSWTKFRCEARSKR